MPRTTSAVTNATRLRLQEEIARAKPHARISSRRTLMEEYGVSRTTIDRAISRLIDEGMLYTKNGAGTYVADRRAGLSPQEGVPSIGVLLPDIRRYTYPGILRGIEYVSFDKGMNLIVGNIENQAARQTHYLQSFIDSGVKGVIIVPARPNRSEDLEGQLFLMLRELEANNIPFVFCNRKAMGMEAPQVISNDFHGGVLAASHLLEQGYKRVAYISHPRYTISLNRCMGYMSALTQAGVDLDQDLVVFSNSWDFEAPGRQEMGRLLDGANPPDAVFCFTDLIAKGAYNAVVERGLMPGRDVGIVGYDDSTVCQLVDVPLSSVKLPSFELGRRSAELLFDFMARPGTPKSTAIILNPELRARKSSQRRN